MLCIYVSLSLPLTLPLALPLSLYPCLLLVRSRLSTFACLLSLSFSFTLFGWALSLSQTGAKSSTLSPYIIRRVGVI